MSRSASGNRWAYVNRVPQGVKMDKVEFEGTPGNEFAVS